MSTSDERALKKAKTVDNESGTSKYRTGTSVGVARVDLFTLCCCCTKRRPYTKSKMYYKTKKCVQSIRVLCIYILRMYVYGIQLAAAACWCAVLKKQITKRPKTKPRRGAPRLTDKRCTNAALVLPSG